MGSGFSKSELPFAYVEPTDSSSPSSSSNNIVFTIHNDANTFPSNDRLQNHTQSQISELSQYDNESIITSISESHFTKDLTKITFKQLSKTSAISLCSKNLSRLSRNVGLLQSTTTLHLCCNLLKEIPPEIGHLKNLTILSLEKNKIKFLPDTIGLLVNLTELKLNHNELKSLPNSIGLLDKLTDLNLEFNFIDNLTSDVGLLLNLTSLNLANNRLKSIPVEIGRLNFLRTLNLDNNPLLTPATYHQDPYLSPPSLKELSARVIIRNQLPILSTTSLHISEYLSSSKKCSHCTGPYFESCVKRIKFVERNEYTVPYEAKLCVAHWNNNQQRIKMLFSPIPNTAPINYSSTQNFNNFTSILSSSVSRQNSPNANSMNSSPPPNSVLSSPKINRLIRKKLLFSTKKNADGSDDASDGTFEKGNFSENNLANNSYYIGVTEVEAKTLPLSSFIVRSPSLPTIFFSRDPKTQNTSTIVSEDVNNNGIEVERRDGLGKKRSDFILKRPSFFGSLRKSSSSRNVAFVSENFIIINLLYLIM
ncbi:hypothetical protein HDU92_001208 [Lobulomyces angularis]|nr:hypothetical protein HDU92_001208 [Lobulomyces angularis]